MLEYSKALGAAVYKHRKQLKMTQAELAEKAGITEQTVRKIEHGNSNPQLEVLVPLIRVLHIDPSEFFYPESIRIDSSGKQLEILLSQCSDAQFEALIPIIRAAVEVFQSELVAAIK